jgi:hypothetical protein
LSVARFVGNALEGPDSLVCVSSYTLFVVFGSLFLEPGFVGSWRLRWEEMGEPSARLFCARRGTIWCSSSSLQVRVSGSCSCVVNSGLLSRDGRADDVVVGFWGVWWQARMRSRCRWS